MAKTINNKKIDNPKIVTVAGGFYYFGDEVDGPDGYICLRRGAMFGGFGGGLGMPGVARGAETATVILDRFGDDQELLFPISAVYAICDSVNLYEFKGTTIRS